MKRICALIVSLAAVLSLTACGEKTSKPESKPSVQVSQPAPESQSGESSEVSENKSSPESSTASKPESSPDSNASITSEATSGESKTESKAESKPESKPESKTESKTETESKPAVKTEDNKTDSTEKSALPLKEYPAGSYFTNDGKPCDNHSDCDWDKPCNCKNFDMSIQSVGFAKYAYFKTHGKHVPLADKKVIDADADANEAKALLKDLPVGAYITVQTGNDMYHAMAVISADDNGITVYQANYGGRCVVTAPTYSWSQFAKLFPHIYYYVK